jgi:hypothetical protein
MKIVIETDNHFKMGWLAHFCEFPIDCLPLTGKEKEIFEDGWKMGHETAALDLSDEKYKNIVTQSLLGRLYIAFLAEGQLKNHNISISL